MMDESERLSDASYQRIMSELNFRKRNKHIHTAYWENSVLIRTCMYCGLDMTHEVHVRAGD